MSQPQAPYSTEQDTRDAVEMLGEGYDHPSVIVEAPRKYTARRHGKMVEVDEPAWVKFSTDFKSELAELDEYSLKVFIYIGLSVDFNTGKAWPGTRKIAKETHMNKDTVSRAVLNLEAMGFLTVERREGGRNIYKPARYISIGTVRPNRTVKGLELSDENEKLSDENEKLSDARRVEMHNKSNKNKQDSRGAGISREWDILHGVEVQETDEEAEFMKLAIDSANEIATGKPTRYAFALQFIVGVHKIPTSSQVKNWRKGIDEWLSFKPNQPTPEHVTQAIFEYQGRNLTIATPYSLSNLYAFANPANGHAPEPKMEDQEWRNQKWREQTVR